MFRYPHSLRTGAMEGRYFSILPSTFRAYSCRKWVPTNFLEIGVKIRSHFTELNDVLSEFYEKHATILSAEEWLEKHPYRESLPDQDEEAWMKI